MTVEALGVPGTHDLWLFAATVLGVNATPGVDLMLLAAVERALQALGGALFLTLTAWLALAPRQ